MEIAEKYIHGKFLEWNVRFVSIVDHADTNAEGNKKAINGLINEWDLEDLSDNIRKTLRLKANTAARMLFTDISSNITIRNDNGMEWTILKDDNTKINLDISNGTPVEVICYTNGNGALQATVIN